MAVEPTSHESSNETDLVQSVLDLCCDRLHVGLTEQDISDVRQLARKTGIRPILVKLTSKRIRDKVYHARKLLKVSEGQQTSRIYINENLSPATPTSATWKEGC